MEAARDQRGLPWLDDLARDLGHGLHLLRRSPTFTAAALVSLALGIGANVAVFSFADTLLLRPLPVPSPGGVLTAGSPVGGRGSLSASYRDYVDIRDRSRTFGGLAAFTSVSAAFAVNPATPPRPSVGMLSSDNLFEVMGVAPHLGRAFRPGDDQVPGRDAVIVLGHDFWLQLGGDRSMLGRDVRLNGIPFTVIGVAPPGFSGLDQYTRFEFYVPLTMWPRLAAGAADPLNHRGMRSLIVKGRLAEGAGIAEAQAELATIGRDLERAYPDTNRNHALLVRTELQNRMAAAPPVPVLLAMLAVLAAAVLLVACANVAGLLSSRAPVRAREIAMRMAIGAGRFRVVRQLITESLLIAVAGGGLGLGVGYAGVALFRQWRFPTDLPISPVFELDQRALFVSLAAAAASAVLFGLAPALRAARFDLNVVIKGTDGASAGSRRSWGRGLLVSGQVAVSVVLLVVAAFVARGFEQRIEAGPGFRLDRLLLMSLDPGMIGYGEAQSQRFFAEVADRAREVSGVTSVTLASYIPLAGRPPRVALVPEGFEFTDGSDSALVPSAMVGPAYFATLSLPIVKGREFTPRDDAAAPRVAIVNELFAARYWPGQDPVGRRFRLTDGRDRWIEVVGLAKNSKYSALLEPPFEFVYFPYAQYPPRRPMFLMAAASAGDPSGLAAPLREMVRTIDSNQPVYDLRSMNEFYEITVVTLLRVISNLVAAMGLIGLLLALTGLYGLVAYSASRRTREIGIRMAIGADRGTVLRMVLQQGLGLALAGMALGLAGGVGIDRALRALLPGGLSGTSRTDVMSFMLVAAAVLAVTLLAAYIPARRAARVNPTEALRYE
jgi:putative ABC transport system permease protein